jgi:hypothetical protein
VSQLRSRLLLATLGILLLWGLMPGSKPPARRQPPRGYGDAALYMKVVARLQAGEPYYDALGEELRRDNYPTRSPLNWRTPLHLMMVALASVPAATMLLKLMTLAAVLATGGALARSGPVAAGLGLLAQMGALASAFRPDAVGVAELWAGALIALSICAYHGKFGMAGAVLGAAAVFVRELAAPYAAACGALALASRQRAEALVWIAAGVVYIAYYGVHASQVAAHQLPGDLAHTQSWLQWNGLQFTLATIGVNGWLGFLPAPVAVLYMVLALAGTASLSAPPQLKSALLTYFGLFAVLGLSFNYYWGFMTAPLWAIGFAHAPDGLRRLVALSVAGSPRTGGPAEAGSRT